MGLPLAGAASTAPRPRRRSDARQTDRAVATDDGHRAWVIRDSLSKLDPPTPTSCATALAGIRKRAGAPSTSPAADDGRPLRRRCPTPASTPNPR